MSMAKAEMIKHEFEYDQHKAKLRGLALQALTTYDKAERLNEQTKDVEALVKAISISQGFDDE